jgi:hypothetical protein
VEGPYANKNPFVALFYVFCLLVSSFLVINLVISVFVDAYYTASSKIIISEENKVEPRVKFPPHFDDSVGQFRGTATSVLMTSAFDMFIAFFIITNITTMAFESYKQSSWQIEFALTTNIIYTLVFGWECMTKLFAFCSKRYFAGGWNRFDFFIVIISYLGILLDGLGTSVPMDPRTLRVLRLFRIFRILRAFRILKSAKGLMRILSTLVRSLPALRNLGMLLALLFFIFAVLGVSLFGGVCVAGEESAPGMEAVRCVFSEDNPPLDPKANFRDLGHALLALFRVATTDGWSSLMYSVLVMPVRKTVNPDILTTLVHLEKSLNDSSLVLPMSTDYMTVAKVALSGWKAAVTRENNTFFTDSWPYPNERAVAYMDIAKTILLNCITDEEAAALEAAKLIDCTALGFERPCSSTCAERISGTLFFGIFTLISAFVIMQLVIAVLLDQLKNTSDKAEARVRTPGCEMLKLKAFARMQRRWRHTAFLKLKQLSRERRTPHSTSAQINRWLD